MTKKMISLDVDAYEKLQSHKRTGESFSDVVRRLRFDNAAPSGCDLLEYFRSGGSKVEDSYLDAVESAAAQVCPLTQPRR